MLNVIMLSVVRLRVFMLSVVMLSVAMLSVVAPGIEGNNGVLMHRDLLHSYWPWP